MVDYIVGLRRIWGGHGGLYCRITQNMGWSWWIILQDDAEYEVVMTDYLAQGGDAYSIIPQEAVRHLQVIPRFYIILTFLVFIS